MRMAATASVLLLMACAESAPRWDGAVDTLPNGAIRVTNPSRGMWEDGRPWRLAPVLVLGEEDGSDATVFGSISGLEVDAAGRIYVLDRQANELRIFTPDGAHLRTVGRTGDGPGEYRTANGLRWLTGDTLVVVDQRANRYTILDAEGGYARTVPRGMGFRGWILAGGVDDGTIYERWYIRGDGPDRMALLGVPLQARAVPMGSETDPSGPEGSPGRRPDTLPLPPMEGPLFQSFSVETERRSLFISVPFAPEPVFHLDGRGGVWHGHGSAFRLLRTSLAGDTTAEVLLDATPTPVTAAELAEWEAGPDVQQFRDMGGRLDLDRIPRVKPFFDALYVDPEGYLWVSVPEGTAEVSFRLVDPDGRYLGILRASGLERDPWLPIVVRGGRLYLVGRDELDVQRVHVFEIER